ncbi:MAG: aconitate hydratase AcnA [Actinomycetes bacterium]
MSLNSFDSLRTFSHGGREWEYFDIQALSDRFDVAKLPFSLRVLLENLLRCEDDLSVRAADIEALASWDAAAEPSKEIAFSPARVVMQDFTGVPAVVDLAAMRDAMADLGGDPAKINPLVPAELVIDHSVQVDSFGLAGSFERNTELEYERNRERYQFLRWGQGAFDGFAVVPPETGIVHQVNLEYLSRVVFRDETSGRAWIDTLVGTDSHTTMVNGLGVLGWGVGGIEAEAAMLGQPMPMLIPRVLGVELVGSLPEAATATDLVLTLTERLREHGVVGKFVEFHGEGLASLPLADRATIGNMSPEFGSTCAIFPVDAETLRYLRFTGRPDDHVDFVEAYCRAQGLFHEAGSPSPVFSEQMTLDLSEVVPSIAGPKRPQDRVSLSGSQSAWRDALAARAEISGSAGGLKEAVAVQLADGTTTELADGHVVIAAITSCTNTSNPSVMVAAGLLARKAVAKGLTTKPWVKTSLAPGSKVVTSYLDRGGLTADLDALGFNLVGYGCTTCIGNSGPLPDEISQAIRENGIEASSVLSGNRNFEGRINPDVTMNWLASPPLVVAYALAGTMDIDLYSDPIGQDSAGNEVMLADIWPSPAEVAEAVEHCLASDMFRKSYGDVFEGDEQWRSLDTPEGDRFAWTDSTYIRHAPYFEGLKPEPTPTGAISGARVLALLGDSVTTDHISPAGAIRKDGPAGKWLMDHGVEPKDFNSYGSRRGNHEVMVRGTFANIRLRNLLAPGTEGGVTLHQPSGEEMSIYDAAIRYEQEGVPLVVLAGVEYGSGSSRDWAAKGTALLGVKAVIARSYERIHRSNLVGMGVLPLQFLDGESAESLGLTGSETFEIPDIGDGAVPETIEITADGKAITVKVRIDTPKEAEYYRNGGILPYVLRNLASA